MPLISQWNIAFVFCHLLLMAQVFSFYYNIARFCHYIILAFIIYSFVAVQHVRQCFWAVLGKRCVLLEYNQLQCILQSILHHSEAKMVIAIYFVESLSDSHSVNACVCVYFQQILRMKTIEKSTLHYIQVDFSTSKRMKRE